MNASSVRIFRCAGTRWTGECPWKCSLWPWPAPTSGPVVPRAPAYDVGDATGEDQHDEHADHAGQAAVAVEEALVGAPVAGEPVVLGHPGEAVRARVGEAAHQPGESEGHEQDGDQDDLGAGAPHAAAPVVVGGLISSSRCASSRRAPYTRSGRT